MANTKALIFLITFVGFFIFFTTSFNIGNETDKNKNLMDNQYTQVIKQNMGVLDYILLPFRAIVLLFEYMLSAQNLLSIGIIGVFLTIIILIVTFDYIIPIIRGN
jgi:hypothetical protein